MAYKADIIEITQVKRTGLWRYRFWKAGEDEPLLVSSLAFPTFERAREVAGKFNDVAFCGGFRLPRTR